MPTPWNGLRKFDETKWRNQFNEVCGLHNAYNRRYEDSLWWTIVLFAWTIDFETPIFENRKKTFLIKNVDFEHYLLSWVDFNYKNITSDRIVIQKFLLILSETSAKVVFHMYFYQELNDEVYHNGNLGVGRKDWNFRSYLGHFHTAKIILDITISIIVQFHVCTK